MKKRLIIMVVISILLMVSCATGTDITKKNRDGSPIWTTVIPKSNRYLYGVGKANLGVSSISENAADASARNDLAKSISVNLQDATSVYTAASSGALAEAYESIIMETVNVTMKGVVVEQRWTAPDGTAWTLVSFKTKNLPKLYEDSANNYLVQLEARRLEVESKLAALLEEFADAKDDESMALKSAAEAKAKELIAECDSVIASVDAKGLSKETKAFLEELGYTFDS